jgi:hypothetical protein
MQTSKTYDTRDCKDHIDLIMETVWMGNLSRKEIALLYGVNVDAVNQWLCRAKYPNKTSLYNIRRLHRHMYNRAKRILAQDYIGLSKNNL